MGERLVLLVEVPAFGRVGTMNAKIFETLLRFLETLAEDKIPLSGIVYLHAISHHPSRVLPSVRIFKALCGTENFKRIFLATTHWDVIEKEDAIERERELESKDDWWADMVKQGSTVRRLDDSYESAQALINEILDRKGSIFQLRIEQEILQKKTLADTEAGAYLHSVPDWLTETEKAETVLWQNEMNMERNKGESSADTTNSLPGTPKSLLHKIGENETSEFEDESNRESGSYRRQREVGIPGRSRSTGGFTMPTYEEQKPEITEAKIEQGKEAEFEPVQTREKVGVEIVREAVHKLELQSKEEAEQASILSKSRDYGRPTGGHPRPSDSNSTLQSRLKILDSNLLGEAQECAETAISLDDGQNVEAAIAAYGKASELLQQAIERTINTDDKQKLRTIFDIYLGRVEEIRDQESGRNELGKAMLRSRSSSTRDIRKLATEPLTYPKIHKDNLSIDTLIYYDLPYEFDKVSGPFIFNLW